MYFLQTTFIRLKKFEHESLMNLEAVSSQWVLLRINRRCVRACSFCIFDSRWLGVKLTLSGALQGGGGGGS